MLPFVPRAWSLWSLVSLGSLFLLPSCGAPPPEDEDPIDAVIAEPGKADATWGECQVRQVLAWVNDPTSTVEALKAAGVATRAAKNLVAHRDGPDMLPGTDDDDPFDDIQELDDVPYVGPKTMLQLVGAIEERCVAVPAPEVVFSPQTYDQSHLKKVVALIHGAERSIDVAMYSFSDTGVLNALQAAVGRGVRVRFIFETASTDRSSPAGTWSAKLEDRGVNVRYINKIMHHKFALIDGPQDSVDQAYQARLVTGSGNWSNSAATRYDENTVVIHGDSELNLRFQKEFNLLWANSRDFVWNAALPQTFSMPITDGMIPDDPTIDAVYTSANFKTMVNSSGPGFSVVSGRNTVADRLVALIQGAESSIHIASGHLRSRPVAEALLARHAARPDLDIRIYLDNQEYVSEWYDGEQQTALSTCLTEAGTSLSKLQACYDRGYYYSFPVQAAGIPLRFKTYCYRWDASYAKQMHHKYFIIDGRLLASGSYNLSDNAEHNTLENLVIYDSLRFGALVQAFEDNFERIWVTGETEGRYAALLEQVRNGTGPFPIVFEPMALDHARVTELKEAIRIACPPINSDPFRLEPAQHQVCER